MSRSPRCWGTAANLGQLKRRQVQLNGLVDASAIYLQGATAAAGRARLRGIQHRPGGG